MVLPKKMALGRGLEALLDVSTVSTEGSSSISEVELSAIVVNPDQPRREFDPEALTELSVSIKQLGIIQPITLRKINDRRYQIIAGERRFRAAQMAGLSSVPAYIKTIDDDSAMEMALVENIQREDLNAIEIALAYKKMLDLYGMTQESLSERLGKKRTTVANYIRLLKLPAEIQLGLTNKRIDMGHARALVSIEKPKIQLQVYNQILTQGLSVRKVEELVRGLSEEEPTPSAPRKALPKTDKEFEALVEKLTDFFRSQVRIKCSDKGKGNLTITFKSEKELEQILAVLDQLKK